MLILWILASLVVDAHSVGPGTSLRLSPPERIVLREEGEMLQNINCTAECEPTCSFVWTKPDKTILTESSVLSLGTVDRSQTGVYSCNARNIDGESVIPLLLVVNLKAQAPTIAIMPAQTVHYVGSTVTLTCAAEGYPPVTYEWMWNGVLFSQGPELQLPDVDSEQSGTYICEVMNTFNGNINRQSRSVNITIIDQIQERPRIPIDPMVNIRLMNNKATLTCSADDDPDYIWLLDGVQVSTSPELDISKASGTYVCIATVISGRRFVHGNRSIGVTFETAPVPNDGIYITGAVLICISIFLFVVTIGLGIFITRYKRLPWFHKKLPDASVDHPITTEVSRPEEIRDYDQLDTYAVFGPSEYDLIGNPNGNLQNSILAAEGQYESLQGRSGPTYEVLHADGPGQYERLQGRSGPTYDALHAEGSV
ncbi:carcinoembryonic antigen-related cell adhesion molecule 5-like isoform X2 [Argopecten irradians]|uniref:carcinoembryonic antigen-related cell adhesion molecule 5-like isoform X2 n=1 Tax=Argopecten irradians TaxID=31199 RepID=UPI003724953E